MLAASGLRQLHVAETEKYAHVTYFFNGGEEQEWEGETRILVPSPRDVPSYDLKPEMSADEVSQRFCDEIGDGYGFAVVNFATRTWWATPGLFLRSSPQSRQRTVHLATCSSASRPPGACVW